ncbi:MAG: C40 family peptidase [Desulfobacterales bacterium]|nr:C40 family peptidase [Desulfobacterales bacterium]
MKKTNTKGISIFLCLLVSGCAAVPRQAPYDYALGGKIIQIAAQYRGTPYKPGGAGPEGFDCSGFAKYVFKKAGIEIPRTVRGQYKSGHSVSVSNMKKGHLVFFSTKKLGASPFSPSHVGIYIGDEKFIHAPSSGGRVRFDSLDDNYWKSRFKGAKDLTGS